MRRDTLGLCGAFFFCLLAIYVGFSWIVAMLTSAGFADVVVVDAGADLNAYASVDGQSGCCSPAMSSTEQSSTSSGCCAPAPAAKERETVHEGLTALLQRYDVNDYAASVKVFAVKPRA